MINLIPMAGLGKRFSDEGYKLPKPLIHVSGMPAIIKVIKDLPKADKWIFIDNFTRLPIENNSFKILKKYFKICIVSPELFKRQEINLTKEILKKNPVDAVLTDNIQNWCKNENNYSNGRQGETF